MALPNKKAGVRTVDIGERYMVSWRNGQSQPGDVIEKRKRRGTAQQGAEDEDQPEDFEYYIHYPNFDRRMDEWVPLARIDTQTVVVPTEASAPQDHKKKKRKTDLKDEKEALLVAMEKENEEMTKVKNIQSIVLGRFEIETWYFSPYPEEYYDDKLYICEYCLKYMKKAKTLANHCAKCHLCSPPGALMYADPAAMVSMFEIDGRDHKLYCQNLCLLSKLFLDHKTLYYDVDPFMFYVLCEMDPPSAGGVPGAHHIVGYFSKEKQSADNYNLACILTFPPYQRKGYGKLLISISYELTKREGTVGSPEKPLSDLGRISYRSYWAFVLLSLFSDAELLRGISIERMSKMTGIRTEDILSTLHSLKMIKFWKGQHVIAVNSKVVDGFLAEAKRIRLCRPDCLTWQPPEKPPARGKGAAAAAAAAAAHSSNA